ncbi:hypothetical protein [Photobacterium alginatilyticum]|nr:hypothetical protein [Photobacterium alginatilyticum]
MKYEPETCHIIEFKTNNNFAEALKKLLNNIGKDNIIKILSKEKDKLSES